MVGRRTKNVGGKISSSSIGLKEVTTAYISGSILKSPAAVISTKQHILPKVERVKRVAIDFYGLTV